MEHVECTNRRSEYSFSKEALPKELSFPLKRSILDSALERASVREQVYSVRYILYRQYPRGRRHKDGHPILEVLFSPEGMKNIHESVCGKNLITVWAVPRQKRKKCEEILIETGLARLCHWLEKASTAGNVWRSTAHTVSFYVQDETLKVEET